VQQRTFAHGCPTQPSTLRVDLTHRLSLKVKVLAEDAFQVVAVFVGDACPAEEFLEHGEAQTRAYRTGLAKMLDYVAERGLAAVPSAWFHEASKHDQILEFIKGPLRLLFFKGSGRQIAVCVGGLRKKTQKADAGAVWQAANARSMYFDAVQRGSLEVVDDEEDE